MHWLLGFAAAAAGVGAAQARPFDKAADRDRVLECYAAHFDVGIIGKDILKLPPQLTQAEDDQALRRQIALKPYVAAYGLSVQDAFRAAAPYASRWHSAAKLQRLVPGAGERLFAEAVERSR